MRHNFHTLHCSTVATTLNMNGLSHGKTAEFCGDVLKVGGSWSYRNKMSTARRLKLEYDATEEHTARIIPVVRRDVIEAV